MSKTKTAKKPAGQARAKKPAASKTKAPKVSAEAKPKAPKKEKPAKEARVTKTSIFLDALKRPDGATVEELMTAASWQAHSVRGFISTIGKKGMKVEKFTRSSDGKSAYKIETAETGNG